MEKQNNVIQIVTFGFVNLENTFLGALVVLAGAQEVIGDGTVLTALTCAQWVTRVGTEERVIWSMERPNVSVHSVSRFSLYHNKCS